jgi:hypothetical protein
MVEKSRHAAASVAAAAPPAAEPNATYAALGRFIERRSPYENVTLPNFGETADDDNGLLDDLDAAMPPQFADKHRITEVGRYKDFNKANPSTLKSEDIPASEFSKYDFGDGVENTVTKAIRIHYKHKRKADGKECKAFIIVLFTGDSH